MTEVLRFSTRLQADDFVVADHRVHGVRIMPGVAFLDMVWRLLEAKGYDPTRVEIRDVLFSEAVALAEGEARRIVIEAAASGDVWEVVARSRIEDRSGAAWSENFRCRVHFGWAGDEAAGSTPFDATGAAVLAMDEVYARARAVVIDHAARMRMTGEIRKAASAAEASLVLTPEAAEYETDYIVHPAVLDTATLVPFVFRDSARITKPYIPLSIERVTLAGPVDGPVLVRVTHDPANDAGGDLLFHDYTLCDPAGRTLVRVERLCAKQIRTAEGLSPAAKRPMTGKTARPAMPASPAPTGDGAPIPSQVAVETFLSSYFGSVTGQTIGGEDLETGFYDLGLDSTDLLEAVRYLERGLGSELYPTLLFERSTVRGLAGYLWEEHRAGVNGLLASGGAVSERAPGAPAAHSPAETLYLRPVWQEAALGAAAAAAGALLARGAGADAVASSWPGERTEIPDEASAALFAWQGETDAADLLSLAGALPREATLVTTHGGGAEGLGLAGLLASVARERPGMRLVALEGARLEQAIAELRRAAAGFRSVRYRDGVREEAGFVEAVAEPHALPEGGAWAITGGLGGLGLTFARALAARGAKVGLIGRSAPDPDLSKDLEADGIVFAQGDVTERESLKPALEAVRAKIGPLTGVIHAAGVLRDGLAGRTSAAEVEVVLAPKIAGARHLDELTRDDPLDWFVLFGSATGSLGNAGQGAYGYANGWLAGFAAERTGPGRSLTLGWPLWERGMAADSAEDAENLRARLGLVPLDAEAGLAAFVASLGQDAPHLVVLHGEAERLRSALELEAPTTTPRSYPEPVKPAAGAVTPTAGAIAVIGLAGRYPGAVDLRAFWRNLAEGVDGVGEVPPERWDHRAYFDAEGEMPGTSWSRWGGFLEGIDLFDPLFFGISPREAKVMDPQERLFLETAWAALEDGALSRDSVKGRKVGVYAGVMWSQYQLYGLAAAQAGSWLQPMSFNSSVANRLSHVLDLHGPSLSLDTACSSSLTALHLAIESLRRGECELAFAGGVNLTLHPSKYQFLGQGRMLSRDGKCRAFGDGGDGYVPGEGVGVALLKPLNKALEDGDPIRGVILGSGVSHGGKTAGYTVPSAERQAELIQSVLAEAGIAPEEVSYVEAHGTGTALGDPIEVEGLKAAFGKEAQTPWCALGSVKSNIGHLESAAGIAGLTKLLLQLEAQELVPSLHAEPLNRHLAIEGTPFRVQTRRSDWTTTASRRIGGLSSFGAGGTNAHLLAAEAPRRNDAPSASTGPELIVLSARSKDALRQRARDLRQWIETRDGAPELAALADTLQRGRSHMAERLAFIAPDTAAVVRGLAAYLEGEKPPVEGEATLAQAAEDYLASKAVDWEALTGRSNPRRLGGLPTYPFERKRYWVDVWLDSAPPRPDLATQAEAVPAADLRVLRKAWRPSPGGPAGTVAWPDAQTVILTSEDCRGLAEALGAGTVLAAPESWADGVAAAGALRREAGELFVFDLSDLGGPPRDRDGLPLGRIAFLQTLLRNRAEGLRLFHVTHGLGEGAEAPSLRGSAMAALMRMLPAEHPGLIARTVDVDTAPESVEAWRDLLAGEAAQIDQPESEIHHLGGDRLRPEMTAEPLVPPKSLAPFVDPEGAYVVTGGTRGIGLALAQALAAAGARRLALIGRQTLPPEADWVRLLADENGDPDLRTKLAPLAALRDAGVEIVLHSGSLTDGDALAAFLARVRASLGPVAGVIHAAGLIGGERPRFLDKQAEDFATVAEPKVEGLNCLLDALATDSLRFVLLCSSIAAAVPRMAAGMSDYALANGYMDALATQRAAGGGATQWLSLQWVGWGDTGMHTRFDESIERMVRDGLGAVGLEFCDSETGVALFAGALSEGLSGAFVAAPVFDERLEVALPGLLSLPPGPAVAAKDETDPDLNSLSDQDLDRLLAEYLPQAPVAAEVAAEDGAGNGITLICAILSEVLELEAGEFGPDTPFRDVGLDSIAALRVAQRLEEETGEAVTPRMLLDHPTARDLAAVLWSGVMEAAQ